MGKNICKTYNTKGIITLKHKQAIQINKKRPIKQHLKIENEHNYRKKEKNIK